MAKSGENKEPVFLHNISFMAIPEKLKSLLILIAFRCQGDRKVCIQSDGSMGGILGASERTIRERLAELVSLGLVSIINPGSPRNRGIELTPKTFVAITSNTQEYIEYVQEIKHQDKKLIGEKSPIKTEKLTKELGENSPINSEDIRLDEGENSPSNTAGIRLQNKNIKKNSNNNSKKEIENDFLERVDFTQDELDYEDFIRHVIINPDSKERFETMCKERSIQIKLKPIITGFFRFAKYDSPILEGKNHVWLLFEKYLNSISKPVNIN